jgi:hypothetical protein
MKWRDPSERVKFMLVSPVVVPIIIVAAPALLVAVGCAWLQEKLTKPFRPTTEWAPWYAWRPICINDWFCADEKRWVWLEAIERRGHHNWTEYRTIGRDTRAIETPRESRHDH